VLRLELLAHLLPLLRSELAVMIEVGAVEVLQGDRLRLGQRHLAVLVGVGRVEQGAGKSAAAHSRLLHARLHLRSGSIELGLGEHAVLVGVSAIEQAPGAGRLGDGRLAALRGDALAVRRFGLGLGDLAVMVGIESVEDLRRVESLGALLDLVGARGLEGIDLGLGHEAIVVGVEPGEHLLDVSGDVGTVLGLRHECAWAGLARLRRRLAGLGQRGTRHDDRGGRAAEQELVHR
jgi:hypothetical protein